MSTAIDVQRTSSHPAAEVRNRLDAALTSEGATIDDGWLTIRNSIDVPAALSTVVSGPLTVVARRRWNDTVADVEIRVQGQPVKAVGSLRLTDTSDGCTVDVHLDVTADVPFMGSMIESAVKPEIVRHIEHELASITD